MVMLCKDGFQDLLKLLTKQLTTSHLLSTSEIDTLLSRYVAISVASKTLQSFVILMPPVKMDQKINYTDTCL